jgi:ATP-binding cassette, subfamily A (ABC1), member 3
MALVKKRLIYFSRDSKGLLCEVLLPCIVILAGMSILLIKFVVPSPAVEISPSYYDIPLKTYYSSDIVPETDMTALMSTFSTKDWATSYLNTNTLEAWDKKNFDDRSFSRLGSYWFIGLDYVKMRFDYMAQVLTLARDSAPLFINKMN